MEVRSKVLLSGLTTLKVGGQAEYLVEVKEVEEVKEAARFASQNALPFFILGGGSNLLCDDAGYPGLVIQSKLKGRHYTLRPGGEVIAQIASGEELDAVVADTVTRGYWGIENLSSIPGTVGATPVQNVGAYGVEMADVIESVQVIDIETEKIILLTKDECQFSYRDSIFKNNFAKKYFILNVNIKLSTTPNRKINYADLNKIFGDSVPTQAEIREAVALVRAKKFPDWRVLGTAGSFFKNPVITLCEYSALQALYPELPHYAAPAGMIKISLGYVLDKVCGLRGYRDGAVGLSPAQALVLINYGGASAEEIKSFVRKIQEIVFLKTKIKIEPEVIFL